MDAQNFDFVEGHGVFRTPCYENQGIVESEKQQAASTFSQYQADQQQWCAELEPQAQSHSAPSLGRIDSSSTQSSSIEPCLAYRSLPWAPFENQEASSKTPLSHYGSAFSSDRMMVPPQVPYHAPGWSVDSFRSPSKYTEAPSRPMREQTTTSHDKRTASTTSVRVPIPANGVKGQRANRNTKGKVPCDMCKKTFAREADRDRHKNDIHKEAKTLYMCTICDTRRSRKDRIHVHLRKKHGEDTPYSYTLRNKDEAGVT